MKKIKELMLYVENIHRDMLITIFSTDDKAKIVKKLKKLDESKNAKYIVSHFVKWNDIDINTQNYFPDLATQEEIIKGIADIEKDMKSLESISHNDLCDFLFSNVAQEDYEQLENGLNDYYDYMDDVFNCLEPKEIWDYLNYGERKALVQMCIDSKTIIKDKIDNSQIVQCILDNTNLSRREIIDKIQNGDTENGTN